MYLLCLRVKVTALQWKVGGEVHTTSRLSRSLQNIHIIPLADFINCGWHFLQHPLVNACDVCDGGQAALEFRNTGGASQPQSWISSEAENLLKDPYTHFFLQPWENEDSLKCINLKTDTFLQSPR